MSDIQYIRVSTTLLYLEDDTFTRPILSLCLIIRPLRFSDVKAFHTLRSQAEPMAKASSAKPDTNLSETQDELQNLHARWRTRHIWVGIFLKNDDNSEGSSSAMMGVLFVCFTANKLASIRLQIQEKV